MAVAQRATSILEALPRQRADVAQPRPAQAPVRRHVRVREPQAGLLLRRAALAVIPAACVLTVVYGRMQHLEATIQRSHLNGAIRQELSKQQVLHSQLTNALKTTQIEAFAKETGLVMQATPPMYVGGRQKGR